MRLSQGPPSRCREHGPLRLVFLLLVSIFVLDALFTSPRAQAAILLVYVVVLLLVLREVAIRRGWPRWCASPSPGARW